MALATLRNSIFFKGLDEQALQTIHAAAQPSHFKKGAFVFQEGEIATAFYVLHTGRIRLTQLSDTGDQVIMGFLGPSDGVGIIAVFPNAEYPLSAQAVQESEALLWDTKTLMWLMEAYPLVAFRTLRMIAGRFVDLQRQYRELATERVDRRIARALLRLVDKLGKKASHGTLIDVPLSRQDLAEMTGTTLYTVSRTLSRWEQHGLIETGREWVIIRSHEGIVAIAEDMPPLGPPEPPACLR